MRILDDDELVAEHGGKVMTWCWCVQVLGDHATFRATQHPAPHRLQHLLGRNVQVTTTHRVNYSEVDQMGVVYHANYLVWLDVARCELLRQAGMSYRELEEERGSSSPSARPGSATSERPGTTISLRIRCWVREVGSRKVGFGYAVEHIERNELLATAVVELMSLSRRSRRPASPRSAHDAAGDPRSRASGLNDQSGASCFVRSLP